MISKTKIYFDPNLPNTISSNILEIPQIYSEDTKSFKRYLVFGSGLSDDIVSLTNEIYSVNTDNGFFLVGTFEQSKVSNLEAQGYTVIPDFLLDLHSTNDEITEISRIGSIVHSDLVNTDFGYTGNGIKVAIIDTGVDFFKSRYSTLSC